MLEHETAVMSGNLLLANTDYERLALCETYLAVNYRQIFRINPLKGRDFNWLHLAIQV